jgi:hypothetical protein
MFKITAKCVFHRGEMRRPAGYARLRAARLYVLHGKTSRYVSARSVIARFIGKIGAKRV